MTTGAEHWERWAESWATWARRPGHDSYWRETRKSFFDFVPKAGRKTLDLGCGEGRVSRDLNAAGHDVVAIDIAVQERRPQRHVRKDLLRSQPAVQEARDRGQDVVDAGGGIGKAVKVQSAADLHLCLRDVLFDHALEVAQRHADTGADVVHAALHFVRDGCEVNAERGILVVDEVVLVIATLFELERQAVRRVFDGDE